MRLLALESASLVASAALYEDGRVTAEYTTNNKLTHSQTLLPMVDEIVRMTGTDLKSLDAIAVSSGPGSFTGLRIGAATAKGLALALEKPIVPVPTLDATACNIFGTDRLVCPVMDARRGQVYNGIYRNQESLQVVRASRALSVEELMEDLNALGEPVILLGDGVPVCREAAAAQLKVPFAFAPANLDRQRAASVAVLGARLFEEGKTVTSGEFVPEYLRKSQAERQREAAEKAGAEAEALLAAGKLLSGKER